MKFQIKYVVIIVLLIAIYSCKRDSSPLGGEIDQQYFTYYETDDGLIMKLDSLHTTYTLDEEVRATFTLINNSDTNSIHIIYGSGPLAVFSMYDQDNYRINYQPRNNTATWYDFYFGPDDTLGASLRWSHITLSHDHYSDLKAYSGTYLITVNYAGIPTGKIGKWININEIGDPVSAKLYYYFTDMDTLRLDFIIRNRISDKIFFELENQSPIEVEFSNHPAQKKILLITPEVEIEKIEIDSRSDQMIYSFIVSKADPVFQNMYGSYYCRIRINCKSRSLSAGSWISF